MKPVSAVDVRIDGEVLTVRRGSTILEACDAAGCYVPRLCYYPGLGRCAVTGSRSGLDECPTECGLCAVRLDDGSVVLACATLAAPGLDITTDDPGLRSLRLERLTLILARHPHICLTCPDRDGCARDECTGGNPPETRCCPKFGNCEFAKLVRHLDADLTLPRRAVRVPRDVETEGHIRREPGLCVGCGRCVRICANAPEAGRALRMTVPETSHAAAPSQIALPAEGTLRASGCKFCGLCVMVCPTGALTAPGEAGALWLDGRRKGSELKAPVLPPVSREPFSAAQVRLVPHQPGVYCLLDRVSEVFRISGVADLRRGLAEALAEPDCSAIAYFQVELDPLYTQRESELLARYVQEQGHLPPGNDLGDDLFDDGEA